MKTASSFQTGVRDTATRLLHRLTEHVPRRDFSIRLWDGSMIEPAPGEPCLFTLVLRDPSVLRTLLLHPSDLTLGEAFIFDELDIEGDLIAAFEFLASLLQVRTGMLEKIRLAWQALQLPGSPSPENRSRAPRLGGLRHSRHRDRAAIAYHYDLSNDFYRLWLDERLVYSCAYFRSADDDLDSAQAQKLDLVCRKLRLAPGERFLDLGCGWGGLVIHAARHYGVRARGVTLSRQQAEWGRARIEALGLQDHCRIDHMDWREVEGPEGFDKISCVGMFEHVGVTRLRECLRRVHSLLKPGGVFLQHGITVTPSNAETAGSTFLRRYVFPDGELLPVSRILTVAERVGFEVRDVESLRTHYELTLRHWVSRLQEHRQEALQHVDEVSYRIWWIYLAGCVIAFRKNNINLHQSLLAKPTSSGDSRLPLTREDWYSR